MNMLFGLYEDKFKYKTRMTTADMSLVRTNAWVETPEKVKPVEARAWEEKEPKQN